MPLPLLLLWTAAVPGFHAGAAEVDVTPTSLPVIVNCGFAEKTTDRITSRLFAKSLVLSEGDTRIALTIVDSCMMPRTLMDRAKAMAQAKTGIRVDRMLIAATHTHSAPSSHACLGSDEQPGYGDFLAAKIAEAIALADQRRVPAELGATAIDVPTHTHSRRFLYLTSKALTDPFGAPNVFANMHPGYENAAAVGPSGPVDPALTLLSVRTRDGQPLAVLANYSMHYFGSSHISADYAGVFAAQLRGRMRAPAGFVPMFSQGTSGDLHWMDYSKAKKDLTIDSYTAGLVDAAMTALPRIRYRDRGVLRMEQTLLTADWRRPDAARLAWARDRLAKLGDVKPRSQPDIYAREAVFLSEKPKAELILQAIRVGDLALAAMPNEVFAITGLKLKKRGPLALAMNLELANGAEGYIPPPEQHALGGYTTWPARSAGLVADTEPRVVEAMLSLLERATGATRRREAVKPGEYARTVARSKPDAYWPMEDLDGAAARGRGGDLTYDGKYALYVEGVDGRAAYLAQAKLRLPFARPAGAHSLEMWQWSAASRRWEHRVEVCGAGGGSGELFLDGASRGAAACSGEWFREAFEGKVDEVAFYRRALTADEIAAHAAAGGKSR